jgi:hypothetical protein
MEFVASKRVLHRLSLTVRSNVLDLVQGEDFIWRSDLVSPVPERLTKVVGSGNKFGLQLVSVSSSNFASFRLDNLLFTQKVSSPLSYEWKPEPAYLKQEDIWPMPGREKDCSVVAITFPLLRVDICRGFRLWRDVITTPRNIWDSMDGRELIEGLGFTFVLVIKGS